jgi:prevent-host-death family protein
MPDPSVQYSIAQASDRLPELVAQAQQGTPVELTRQGKRVAVILSTEEYDRMSSQKPDFWELLTKFRERLIAENIDIDPDEVFKDIRDKSPGRDVNL